MLRNILNWRFLFTLIAFAVVGVSIYLSHSISQRLETAERKNVEIWGKSLLALSSSESSDEQTMNLLLEIASSNTRIPVILTDTSFKVLAIKNVDTTGVVSSADFFDNKIKKYASINEPLELSMSTENGNVVNYAYYGESDLLELLRYFPYILLVTFFVMLGIVIVLLTQEYSSAQDKLWLGMSKETAHQLGTPLSSLQGWVDLLESENPNFQYAKNMRDDIARLNLVADRFSKIGSKPQLLESNITKLIGDMADYMRLRASRNVEIHYEPEGEDVIGAVNPQLFTWVIENLIRNAIDVLKGKGNVWLRLSEDAHNIYLEVQDDGTGITPSNVKKIFKPGFTTKKRGWGIGLSLTKRIIEIFHNGNILVKNTSPEGTTFLIKLKKQSTYDIRKKI